MKLYVYAEGNEGKQWKDRALGELKFLRSRSSGIIRMIARQDKTLKIRCNHLVRPDTEAVPHAGSDKAFRWNAVDVDDMDSVTKLLQFAAQFKSPGASRGS